MKKFFLLPLVCLGFAIPATAQAHYTENGYSASINSVNDVRGYCRTSYSGIPWYSCYQYPTWVGWLKITAHTYEVRVQYREAQNWGQGWFFYYCTVHTFRTHEQRRRDLEYIECN